MNVKVIVRYSAEVVTPFAHDFFQRVADETIRSCPTEGVQDKEVISFNAVSVTRERIQELNTTYRKKKQVTDILSFGEYADTAACGRDPAPRIFLGEIFFCYDVIASAALEDSVTQEHELTYVFSHGVLHLLGYDHGDAMFAIQDAVTAALVGGTPASEEGK